MKFSKSQSYSLLAAALTVAAVAGHRTRVQPFGPELAHHEYFAPSEEVGFAETHFFSGPAENPTKVATDFVESKLTASDYIIKNAYTSKHNGVTHVYLRQVIDGLEVVNGDINVNVDRDGNVISYGNSFFKGALEQPQSIRDWIRQEGEAILEQGRQLAFGRKHRGSFRSQKSFENEGTLSPQDAFLSFAKFLNIEIARPDEMDIVTTYSLNSDKAEVVLTKCPLAKNGKVPVNQAYIQTEEGSLELVYDFQVEMKETDNWFHVQVHAETGKVMQLVDWVSDVSYNVYPMGVNDPLEGSRTLLKDPHHPPASPLGWNRQLKQNFTNTAGNNVYAGDNRRNSDDWQSHPRAEGKVDSDGELVFDFPIDFEKDPGTYIDAATTNLFYWNNQVHDVFHHFGFDEESGNFQEDNFGRGGLGGDAVIANAQDGSGFNNANFATPPDGQRGQMRMYVWDLSEVPRDGDLESGIVIHEYSHGVSTRLTGGPANSGCLGWGEAGGMGEGWGDFFATMFRMNPSHDFDSEFPMGAYANNGKGIRKFPYSTSFTTNPETFKVMDGMAYWGVHAKGEVWAEMLFEVYQNLHKKLPFTEDWYTNDKTSYANTLVLQLVIDGMKLQPCMPTFTKARDAILQAEKQLTKGKYRCAIWKGFAKRGLGTRARAIGANSPFGGIRSESFELPKGCK